MFERGLNSGSNINYELRITNYEFLSFLGMATVLQNRVAVLLRKTQLQTESSSPR